MWNGIFAGRRLSWRGGKGERGWKAGPAAGLTVFLLHPKQQQKN